MTYQQYWQAVVTFDPAAVEDLFGDPSWAKQYPNVVQRLSSSIGSRNDVFKEAKSGGKHSGTYENYKDRPIQELERSLNSYEKQVITHKDKIANP
jgi:hypothetical protein